MLRSLSVTHCTQSRLATVETIPDPDIYTFVSSLLLFKYLIPHISSVRLPVLLTAPGTSTPRPVPVGATAAIETLLQAAGRLATTSDDISSLLLIGPDDRLLQTQSDVDALPTHAVIRAVMPSSLAAPVKERIFFPPHPKTLTMAGDYEYFAAEGTHPFAYALAELIDNAMRATRTNTRVHGRDIIISLVTATGGQKCIAIEDNGCGMTAKELNNWAVMNLSMADRGQQPSEPLAQGRVAQGGEGTAATGVARFLSGELSYFGVGSKNAAFFLGDSIKISTRAEGASLVHELTLRSQELEARYREGANVYEGEILHRPPGDTSTLGLEEGRMPVLGRWVRDEVASSSSAALCPSSDGEGVVWARKVGGSFTRVVISDLKPEIVERMGSEGLCPQLAHLYHYYLHGSEGNRRSAAGTGERAVGAEEPTVAADPGSSFTMPRIVVQHLRCTPTGIMSVWSNNLRDVDTDLETQYLRNMRQEMRFRVDVPDRGTVEGMLWYFPFQYDHETLPDERDTVNRTTCMSTSTASLLHPTNATHPNQPTQSTTQHPGGAATFIDLVAEDDADALERAAAMTRALEPRSLFELFWQGRLIPGTRVDSLPFIEAVRTNRTAKDRDLLPDEAFMRVRGALFLGPAFKVTRNKLNFRDPVAQLLASGIPSDRKINQSFRDWLRRAHQDLDKAIAFAHRASPSRQEEARTEYGADHTLFDEIRFGAADGSGVSREVHRGQVVKLNMRPVVIGRVEGFLVPKAVPESDELSPRPLFHAHGMVIISPLPAALHAGRRVAIPLSRLAGEVSELERSEYEDRELKKCPQWLVVEARGPHAGPGTSWEHWSADSRRGETPGDKSDGSELAVEDRKYPAALASGASSEDPPSTKIIAATAGDVVPEMAVQVLDGNGKEVRGMMINGQKRDVAIVQVLRRRRKEHEDMLDMVTMSTAGTQVAPTGRARTKGKKKTPSMDSATITTTTTSMTTKEWIEIARHRNVTPFDGRFVFKSLHLPSTGDYELAFEIDTSSVTKSISTHRSTADGNMEPEACELPMVRLTVPLRVHGGVATSAVLVGEGVDVLRSRPVSLLEHVPELVVSLRDDFGNAAAPPPGLTDLPVVVVVHPHAEATSVDTEAEVVAEASVEVMVDGSGVRLTQLRFLLGNVGGASSSSVDRSHVRRLCASDGVSERMVSLDIQLGDLRADPLAVTLRPGPPEGLVLVGPSSSPDNWGTFVSPWGRDPSMPRGIMSEFRTRYDTVVPDITLRVVDRWGNHATLVEGLQVHVRVRSPLLVSALGASRRTPLPAFPLDVKGQCILRGLASVSRDACARPFGGVSVGADGNATSHLRMWIEPLTVPAELVNVYPTLETMQGRGTDVYEEDGDELVEASPVGKKRSCRGNKKAATRSSKRHKDNDDDDVVAEKEIEEAPTAYRKVGYTSGSLVLIPSRDPAQLAVRMYGSLLLATSKTASEVASGTQSTTSTTTGRVVTLTTAPQRVGSVLSGLTLEVLDEAGRPVEEGTKGSFETSWSKDKSSGNKVVVMGPIPLKKLKLPETVAESPTHVVRFLPRGAKTGMEVRLIVPLVPLEPTVWGMSLVARGAHGPTLAPDDLGTVGCGQELVLDIEPLDRLLNRTGHGDNVPTPEIVAVPRDGRDLETVTASGAKEPQPFEVRLVSGKWEGEGLDCLYRATVTVKGPAGDMRVGVRDRTGPRGRSQLSPDDLELSLVAGPPSRLLFEGPQTIRCGAKAALEGVQLALQDSFGNPCQDHSTGDVVLNPSALSVTEGAAACAVSVRGGNRVSIQDGAATFSVVSLNAGAHGTYRLEAKMKGKGLAGVEPAFLTVVVEPANTVTAVKMVAKSVPGPGVLVAGTIGPSLTVKVTTEDGRPLPPKVAAEGLSLILTPPKAKTKADTISIPYALSTHAEDKPRKTFDIALGDALIGQGKYTVAAQFRETRPEVARGLTRAQTLIRSPALEMEVDAGPVPEDGSGIEPLAHIPENVTCADHGDYEARSLLPGVGFRAVDSWGNTVMRRSDTGRMRVVVEMGADDHCAGAALTICHNGDALRVPTGKDATPKPVLEDGTDRVAVVWSAWREAGEDGVFQFGAFSLGKDSVTFAPGTSALIAGLTFQWQRAAEGEALTISACAITVESDSARAEQLKDTERLLLEGRAKVDRLQEEADEHQHSLVSAQRAITAAEGAVAPHRATLVRLGWPEKKLPATAAAAREAAEKEEEKGREGPEREASGSVALAPIHRLARMGPPRSELDRKNKGRALLHKLDTIQAIESGMSEEDLAGVEGFLVRLATVEDAHLARVLSANLGFRLCTLVVRDSRARQAVEGWLKRRGGGPAASGTTSGGMGAVMSSPWVPDILPLTNVNSAPSAKVAIPLPSDCPERVRKLHEDAVHETDAMVAWDLPHESFFKRGGAAAAPVRGGDGDDVNSGNLSAGSWPQGCLGFIVNLLRPTRPGLRTTVLQALLGRSILFDDLASAEQYRAGCVKLGVGCPDLLSMQGEVVTGSGVVRGSHARVDTSRDPDFMLGAASASQTGAGLAQERRGATLSLLALAMEELEAAQQAYDVAEAASRAAREALAAAEQAWSTTEAELEAATLQLHGRASQGVKNAGNQPAKKGKKGRGKRKEAPAEENSERSPTRQKRVVEL